MSIDTNHFKEILEKELELLESELATVGRKNPDQKGDWEATEAPSDDDADVLDVAEKIEEYETNRAILDQLEARLNEVKKALQNIEDGKYAVCDVCGEKIEEDRLEANPSASTCKTHM